MGKDLHTENYESLWRETTEDPNKRRDAPCCGLDDIGVSFHQNQQNG